MIFQVGIFQREFFLLARGAYSGKVGEIQDESNKLESLLWKRELR